MKIIGLNIFLFLICSLGALSNIDSKENFYFNGKEKRAKRDSIKQAKIKAGKMIITPVGAPVYTPEFGFMIAGGVITSFKTNKSDPSLNRSFFPATIGFSTTGALIFQSNLNSFWLQNKLQINGSFIARYMSDHYWGVGYLSAQDIQKGDSTTSFKKTWYLFNPEFNWQFRENYFIGVGIDLNYTAMNNLTNYQKADPDIVRYGTNNYNGGVGLILKYDSRDIPINAYGGMMAKVNLTYYGPYLFSDNEYSILQLDFRKYVPVTGKGKTLAIQFKSRFSSGNIPYGEMSMVGSPFDLRGYYWGNYRDKNMMLGIVEYRHRFDKINSNEPSKVGAVVWAGTGSVSSTLNEFSYWMPNLGIGLRYELQPRLNLRLDYGIGYNTTGFYFNFSEAF